MTSAETLGVLLALLFPNLLVCLCGSGKHSHDLVGHRNEVGIITVVEETLEVLDLVVELLLDVVFHLVGDEPRCDLLADLCQDCEVVGCKVLLTFLVSHLKNAYSVISKLDRNEKSIANRLVQTGVDVNVVAKLGDISWVLDSAEVLRLASVEDR